MDRFFNNNKNVLWTIKKGGKRSEWLRLVMNVWYDENESQFSIPAVEIRNMYKSRLMVPKCQKVFFSSFLWVFPPLISLRPQLSSYMGIYISRILISLSWVMLAEIVQCVEIYDFELNYVYHKFLLNCISNNSSLHILAIISRSCLYLRNVFLHEKYLFFSLSNETRRDSIVWRIRGVEKLFSSFSWASKDRIFFRNTIHNDTWWGKKRMKNFSSPDSDIATEGNFPKNVTEWACEDDKDKLTKSAKKKMFFSCREMLSNIVSMMWTVVSNLWLMITNRKNHTEKCENVFSAHFIPQINESTLTSVAPCPIHICDSLEKFNLSPLQISAE